MDFFKLGEAVFPLKIGKKSVLARKGTINRPKITSFLEKDAKHKLENYLTFPYLER